MAKQKRVQVHFPLGGLNRRGAYKQQPPYTTPDCMNVRPMASIEGRERGGSRPGLMRSHVDALGGPVRLLSPMTVALGDNFTAFSDTFGGLSLASAWTQAAWAAAAPAVLPTAMASIDTSVADAAAVLDALPVDASKTYSVEMLIAPWLGTHHGNYRLYLRVDDAAPAIGSDGVVVELTLATDGDYSGTLTSVTGGVETQYPLAFGTSNFAEPGWLTAQVDGDEVTVYWRGQVLLTQTVDSHAGLRVGFGMECTSEGGVCLVNVFRVQYYSTAAVSPLRTLLVASADGDLYQETQYGRLEAVPSSLSVRGDVPLTAAQSGQELFIADYGDVRVTGNDGTISDTALTATGVADWTTLGINTHDDVVVISDPQGSAVAGTYQIASVAAGGLTLAETAGAGACEYRIERAPKVYNPAAGTLSILSASTGQVPTGCPLVCRYLDRLVVAGATIAPHVWYMSRAGDPTDWDYSQTDSQRAVAGTSSEAGVPGSPITALVPHSDDYLVIGCQHSLWRLRGDPAYGGSLDALSRTVGIIGPQAWCLGPTGELVFLSLDGLYVLPPGGDSVPISLSREYLPQEFLNLDPNTTTALLEYDVQGRGVHVFLTPDSPNARTHWWIDWDRKTFWPVSLEADHEPTATCAFQTTAIEDAGVLLGSRDGCLYRFSDCAATDCGWVFSTCVLAGPMALAADGAVGTLASLEAILAENSGPVNWEVRPALTFEAATRAAASSTGQWTAGINAPTYNCGRGQAYALRLSGEPGIAWAMEHVAATVRQAGRLRLA